MTLPKNETELRLYVRAMAEACSQVACLPSSTPAYDRMKANEDEKYAVLALRRLLQRKYPSMSRDHLDTELSGCLGKMLP